VSVAPLQQPAADSFFCVHGFSFVLRTNDAHSSDSIVRLYRPFVSQDLAAIGVDAVFRNENGGFNWRLQGKSGIASDVPRALCDFESALCEAIIRSQRRLIAIHAATVYSADSAVLLLGPSGAGKSTLSVALSRRGFMLATDDVALIDPETLDVHPIPRCVHLDQRSVQLLEADGFKLPESWKRFSFVAPIDLNPHYKPLPRYKAGLLIYIAGPRAQHPHLKPVSQSEMAARLLSETGQGPLSDSEALNVLVKVSSSAACFSLAPGSLSETADALSDLILRHPRAQSVSERGAHRVAEFG
jgi:hypothetical protein